MDLAKVPAMRKCGEDLANDTRAGGGKIAKVLIRFFFFFSFLSSDDGPGQMRSAMSPTVGFLLPFISS